MTITRGFGLSISTQTGETARWAAGDPASVAAQLDTARERMRAANVPTLDQIRERMGPMVGAEVLGSVRRIAVEYAAGDDSAPVVGVRQTTLCALCNIGAATAHHDAETGRYRVCGHCGSDYAGATELALNRKPCRCAPDGCSGSACAGRAR